MHNYKLWSKEEIEFLKENYQKLTKKELASMLGRPYWCVCWKCRQLGLKKEVILSDLERGYLAGFLDGESSFQLTTHHSRYDKAKTKRRPFVWNALIYISNTNREVIEHLKDLVGVLYTLYPKANSTVKNHFTG